ncbi:MAG: FkbM family methyltransferase [Legionella sp.]|nr:FkbM family methyltransferase [Legionella sp.]
MIALNYVLTKLKLTIMRCKPLYLLAHNLMAVVRYIKLTILKIITLFFQLIELISTSKSLKACKFDSFIGNYVVTQSGMENYLVSTSDKVIGRALYVRGEFDFNKFIDVWELSGLNSSEKAVTLIDIGANIGSIGIPAVMRGYAERCIAFEPEPLNAKLLKINIILNDLEDKIDVFQVALGNKEGEVFFELSDSNYGDHRVRLGEPLEGRYGEQNRKTISVPMRTLNEYLNCIDEGASLIWMDTQGFEGYVLKGADRFLKYRIPLVLEFWPYGLKRSDSYKLLLESLEKSEYKHFINLNSDDKDKVSLSRKSLDMLSTELELVHEDHFTDILVL